jgi:hypothetical protein
LPDVPQRQQFAQERSKSRNLVQSGLGDAGARLRTGVDRLFELASVRDRLGLLDQEAV